MKCPKSLISNWERINAGGVIVEKCKSCGGVWFDGGEFYELADKDKFYTDIFRDKIEIKASQIELPIKCPKCNVNMHKVKKNETRIDVCPDCKSIWTDKGEFSKIADNIRES